MNAEFAADPMFSSLFKQNKAMIYFILLVTIIVFGILAYTYFNGTYNPILMHASLSFLLLIHFFGLIVYCMNFAAFYLFLQKSLIENGFVETQYLSKVAWKKHDEYRCYWVSSWSIKNKRLQIQFEPFN